MERETDLQRETTTTRGDEEDLKIMVADRDDELLTIGL